MARYIETGTTEFEQFDGSNEMCEKYGIRPDMETTNIVTGIPMFYSILTHEGEIFFEVGAWIATGVDDEHHAVEDEIFRRNYKRLPQITDGVAQIIESAKNSNKSLGDVISEVDIALTYTTIQFTDRRDKSWILNHSAEFARAWLDGYEVAK